MIMHTWLYQQVKHATRFNLTSTNSKDEQEERSNELAATLHNLAQRITLVVRVRTIKHNFMSTSCVYSLPQPIQNYLLLVNYHISE